MKNRREYQVAIEWQGNTGAGTKTYSTYERAYSIQANAKSTIAGSSDPKFRGDPAFWNPENLLVASLSACHQLWYLSLCAKAGIIVAAYEDVAVGIMIEEEGGGGQFERVLLQPRVTLTNPADRPRAAALHEQAHALCFIARSVNFPVDCEPLFV
jgi:organic hydroperoxide reductase OsmC/OhrA